MSHQFPVHPVPEALKSSAHITADDYAAMYRRSVEDPEGFWAEQAAEFLDWDQQWTEVMRYDFRAGEANWFAGGKLNVSVNCIDRHLGDRADQVALIWEGDDPADDKRITYRELHEAVCRLANGLRERGVKKGDRVCIYMPMIPEAAYAMLACARIGAVHSVVFGGFSPESLKDRILDSDCRAVITADEGVRGGKKISLKANTDKALASCPNVHSCIVVRRTGGEVEWDPARDVWYEELVATQSTDCEPESMDAEDPLFILYTSGSTGKPKGVLHTTGGYLLQAAMTFKYVFDYRDLAGIRGRTHLPGRLPLLAGLRQARCQHLLYSAHRDPRPARARRRAGGENLSRQPAPAGNSGRAHQPGGLGVVLQRGRGGPLSRHRHLVADRDRRPHDHPHARRHGPQARQRHLPLLRRTARPAG